MKTLLYGGKIVNVFTDSLENADVLMEDDVITGVGSYSPSDADNAVDVTGKILCPGFVDGHIHIESTMLLPGELARTSLPHGTTCIVADPHEIANVCGTDGLRYMIQSSEGLPMEILFALPSCVPATPVDEAGAVLDAAALRPFYNEPRVVALGELMNYPGLLAGDPDIYAKIRDARDAGRTVNGHAPLLTGHGLDQYIAAGVSDDHECTTADEAMERLRKGQWVMIRQGTAARDLIPLLPLFEEPYNRRCLLVTDDRHPADLLRSGHIDDIIRTAVQNGKSPLTGIRMASLQAAQCFGLRRQGAIAPGWRADVLVLDDLDTVHVQAVYTKGQLVAENGAALPFKMPPVDAELTGRVTHSMHTDAFTPEQFFIEPKGEKCRVIHLLPGQLLTEEEQLNVNWKQNNGIDTELDLLKLAVAERHHHTGHIGLGFLHGLGLPRGAIASTVSHDAHNLIIVGTRDDDMAFAANTVREMGGGSAVVADGKVLARLPLPIAGLMSPENAETVAEQNRLLRQAVIDLGAHGALECFMATAFVSLPVIPHIKMTTYGPVHVDTQKLIPLFVD